MAEKTPMIFGVTRNPTCVTKEIETMNAATDIALEESALIFMHHGTMQMAYDRRGGSRAHGERSLGGDWEHLATPKGSNYRGAPDK
jgi:hypothetical protein